MGGWLVLACLGLPAVAGCAPPVIQDYSVRRHELVFVVQEGSSYRLGDCRRADNGDLSQCRLYDVEFE